jgi:Tfp pilus assembly protein PilF
MTTPADALRDVPDEAFLRHAAALEARGAWSEAIAAWTDIAQRHAGSLPAMLGLAQAQIRAGRPADALPALEQVRARAPGHPATWLALGVAHSMLGEHDTAIDCATRARSLAPGSAIAELGLADVLRAAGRFDDAVEAYRRAAAIAPDYPDALNKLAVVERALGHGDVAEILLRRALANAPNHPYARVNLATLELERGRDDQAIAALRDVLALPGMPPDAREEAEGALLVHDDHVALAAPLAASLASDSPAPLDAALRAGSSQAGHDESLLAELDELASRIARASSIDATFATGRPVSPAWPALEAHHNFHRPIGDEDLARSVALVAGQTPCAGLDDLDVLRYAQAVASRGRDAWPLRDATACLAWLQWRHAQLCGHRADLAPGRLKLINNLVTSAPQVTRTLPRRIAGTLSLALSRLMPRIPEGAWRAVFLYAAIGEIHPFRDGNGRVMRFMLNRMLADRGLYPHLRRAGDDGGPSAHARKTGDPMPLAGWLAEGSRYAADLDRRWAARGPLHSGATPR